MSEKKKIKDFSLYLVTSQEYMPERKSIDVVMQAVSSGVDVVQMREKAKSDGESLVLGMEISRLCSQNGVIFIVNDSPSLAVKVGADGVHLGQDDIEKIPINMARDILGKDKIIGLSTHSVEQVIKANEYDVDYIAFGPIFPTKTKDYSVGTEHIEEVLKISKYPVVFIGGINPDNAGKLLGKGAKNIAAIRSIIQSKDIYLAVRKFKEILHKYKEKQHSEAKD